MTRQLYIASCQGFSATCDAFVVSKVKDSYFEDLRLLSIIGGQAGTKAIAAGILKRNTESVWLRPETNDEDLEAFSALRMDVSRPWRSRTMRLPESKAWHTLVYSTMLEFNQDEPSFVLLADPGTVSAVDKHLQFLNRRVALPVHPSWKDWLWERGLTAGEIKPLLTTGVSAWECTPDHNELKADITAAIQEGLLTVPREEVSDAKVGITS